MPAVVNVVIPAFAIVLAASRAKIEARIAGRLP
jgi:hypothetical protein